MFALNITVIEFTEKAYTIIWKTRNDTYLGASLYKHDVPWVKLIWELHYTAGLPPHRTANAFFFGGNMPLN